MNTLKIFKEKNELLSALAELICNRASNAIKLRGEFNFVLSGGESPKSLYELLASEKFKTKIDWTKTYFFFGDERFVPEDDDQRNSLMAQHSLFDPLGIKETNIFKVDCTTTAEDAAQKYKESINRHFGIKPIQFDFCLLGLGSNAHTASLFPNTSVLNETEATIRAIFIDEVKMFRITMTAPLINKARTIAFLVFGKDKADAVYEILEGNDASSNLYPARLIQQEERKIYWFLDHQAAGRLQKRA